MKASVRTLSKPGCTRSALLRPENYQQQRGCPISVFLNANYANSTNFRKSHFYKYKYISNLYFVSICGFCVICVLFSFYTPSLNVIRLSECSRTGLYEALSIKHLATRTVLLYSIYSRLQLMMQVQ